MFFLPFRRKLNWRGKSPSQRPIYQKNHSQWLKKRRWKMLWNFERRVLTEAYFKRFWASWFADQRSRDAGKNCQHFKSCKCLWWKLSKTFPSVQLSRMSLRHPMCFSSWWQSSQSTVPGIPVIQNFGHLMYLIHRWEILDNCRFKPKFRY